MFGHKICDKKIIDFKTATCATCSHNLVRKRKDFQHKNGKKYLNNMNSTF
jgi:hypothetical protein